MNAPKIILFLALCMLSFIPSKSAWAQEANRITPLHEFFQANYDSTIILHNWSSWYSAPNYVIMAKHKGKLYYFTYSSPYQQLLGAPFPGNLSQKFRDEETKFNNTAPDTNRYFLSRRILQETLVKHWNELQTNKLWSLKDDKTNLTDLGKCMIEDGTTSTFFLIDKAGIRISNFNEPEYWEECLGKDIYRQRAIQVKAVFQSITMQE
jgi:hypothetical protein